MFVPPRIAKLNANGQKTYVSQRPVTVAGGHQRLQLAQLLQLLQRVSAART
ncbi:MAG: hypothetical protein ABTR92_12990 [Candidatus Accumulibacter phosphatis]|jgi:hypothetical protein|uniref:hypothetical protein n=1 Tax=Candidatus Accumulibacter sp. ACC012 TaxID=2823332 RepID=UPI00145CCB6B|nr:hypothetical protein [Candidatus Accumulibacter sp. ACC012]